ncbi:MAG: hypothetical protein P8Y54_09905 [Xanthomonadales bacterium]
MIRWQRTGGVRHPARTWLIRCGITLAAVSGAYLLGGMLGVVPMESTAMAWNNIRIVSGAAIAGCLMAAVGYGNE